jgi:hypothetical protein
MPVTTRSQAKKGVNVETEAEIGPYTLDSWKMIRRKFWNQLMNTTLEMLEAGGYSARERHEMAHLYDYNGEEFRNFYDNVRRRNHGLVLYSQCQSTGSVIRLEDMICDMVREWLQVRCSDDDTDDDYFSCTFPYS